MCVCVCKHICDNKSNRRDDLRGSGTHWGNRRERQNKRDGIDKVLKNKKQ